jgi:hypothetical protein
MSYLVKLSLEIKPSRELSEKEMIQILGNALDNVMDFRDVLFVGWETDCPPALDPFKDVRQQVIEATRGISEVS